jgi:hypothetical protein
MYIYEWFAKCIFNPVIKYKMRAAQQTSRLLALISIACLLELLTVSSSSSLPNNEITNQLVLTTTSKSRLLILTYPYTNSNKSTSSLLMRNRDKIISANRLRIVKSSNNSNSKRDLELSKFFRL